MAIPYEFTAGTLAKATEVNANFDYLDAKTAMDDYCRLDEENTTGLTLALRAGVVVADGGATTVTADTYTLTPSAINYVEIKFDTAEVVVNTTGFTPGRQPLYQISVGATAFNLMSDVIDCRTWAVAPSDGVEYTADETSLELDGTEFSIKDGGVTDAKLGDRTVDQALITPGNTGSVTSLMSWLAGAVKAATGETNWYDTPDTTLAAAKVHADAAAPHSGHLDADGSKPLTATWDVGGNTITNLATPSSASDAVTKAYADALAAGIRVKAAVLVATTANLGSLSGLLTIDSVALSDGDRVLVKNQTTPTDNGIYVASSGSWSRATDADAAAELDAGATVYVQAGTTQQKTNWTQINAVSDLGTDNQQWTQSSSVADTGITGVSNLGSGAGVLYGVAGATLQARSLVAGSSKVTATQNTNDVTLDVVEANLTHDNIGGILGVAKGGTGLTTVAAGELPYGIEENTYGRLAPNATGTSKFLRCVSGVLSWVGIAPEDYAIFTTLTRGAVPAPNSVDTSLFLCTNGEWRNPALAGPRLKTISATSHTIGTGSKTFTIPLNMSYSVGTWLTIASTASPSNYMVAQVTSYPTTSPTITVNVVMAFGSGTFAAWSLNASGEPGQSGDDGVGGTSGSTDNAVLRADGTGGSMAQGSPVTISDAGALGLPSVSEPDPATGLLYSVSGALKWAGKFVARWSTAIPINAGFVQVTADGELRGASINTGILLGRSTASNGSVEEIEVGDGLDLTDGVLSATGGGGASSFDSRDAWLF